MRCDTTKDAEHRGMWDLSGEPQNTLPVFSPSQLGIRLLLVPTEHQEQLFSPGKEAVK